MTVIRYFITELWPRSAGSGRRRGVPVPTRHNAENHSPDSAGGLGMKRPANEGRLAASSLKCSVDSIKAEACGLSAGPKEKRRFTEARSRCKVFLKCFYRQYELSWTTSVRLFPLNLLCCHIALKLNKLGSYTCWPMHFHDLSMTLKMYMTKQFGEISVRQ